MYKEYYNSPIGYIKIEAEDNKLVSVKLMEKYVKDNEFPNEITNECKKELEEYFLMKRKIFNLPYKFKGTEFQCEVWKALSKVLYGKVVTYKYIAEQIGKPEAVRAVANAIGKNNLLIIIPCHRVIGSNGKLTGFSAKTNEKNGLEIKQKLLDIEKNKNEV